MKIDSHQHYWIYDPVRDSWIDDTMKVLQKDFLPGDLFPALRKQSINGTVAVQADQSEEETNFLLNVAEENDWIKGVVGWVDLKAGNIEQKLRYFSQFKKLKGFRHIVQTEPDEHFMLDPAFQNGIRYLKDFNFSYDILIYPKQLPAAIRLAENHPDQVFVLDHMAKPFIKDRKIEPWAAHILELAKNPNVACKLSGIITEADHQNWKADDCAPYMDVVFESFGVERLMFGSDWPVCLLAGTYEQVVMLVEDYVKNQPGDVKEKIFGKNARRIYQL
jgi:L-fuconolactonase